MFLSLVLNVHVTVSSHVLYEQSLGSLLDPDIWNVANSEKVSPYFKNFVNICNYCPDKIFIRTKFHEHFCEELKKRRTKPNHGEKGNFIVGIQGIGKSSSTVYYVLSCINNGDNNIHYIDMEEVRRDKELNELKTLREYAKLMSIQDCLIIDNATVFNECLVNEVKLIVPARQIVMIETGFSSCRPKYGLDFRQEMQLKQAEFEDIWISSCEQIWNQHTCSIVNKEEMKTFVNNLYDRFKEKFIMTPGLLHFVLGCWYSSCDEELRYDVGYLESQYFIHYRERIYEFKEDLSEALEIPTKKNLCHEFSINTKVLLYQICPESDFILTNEDFIKLKVPINIFQCQYKIVVEKDVEDDIRFELLGLEKGNVFYRIRHLIPVLAPYWKEVFDFKIQDLFQNELGSSTKNILKICFQSGGIRKEFEKELLQQQIELKSLILPSAPPVESICRTTSSNKCIVKQCIGICLTRDEEIVFRQPTRKDLEKVEIRKDYKNHDKDVARCAMWLKKEIEKENSRILLVQPLIENLKGIDYFLYTDAYTLYSEGPAKKKKKTLHVRKEHMLYLVQVATGSSHIGTTVRDALEIFKKTIENIVVHVMIVIARKDTDSYTLNGNVFFENISVVNLTRDSVRNNLEKNKVLGGLLGLIMEV